MKKTKNTTGKQIPVINLLAHYKASQKEIDLVIKKVLSSGWYILGKEVENFENEFAKYLGVNYAVGVSSGTDALTLSLKALDLGSKDGVIIPANVYPTAFGVALSGVKIQLCDIDTKNLNISLETIKKSVDKTTKAIVVVHLYGNPVDLDPILDFARKNNIYVIEDCAQAVGAKYKGKNVGSLADLSCFSFYPTKNLGAFGDGGMVTTSNKRIFNKLKLLRMYGEKKRYKSVLIGHNSRLDEIQAGILNLLLKKVDRWNKKRRDLAEIYKDSLKNLPLELVEETANSKSCCHLFVIKTKFRDKLSLYLAQNKIGNGIHYPYPIHLTTSFKYLGHQEGDFPISEIASKEVLSLPLFPELTVEQVLYVVGKIREFFKQK